MIRMDGAFMHFLLLIVADTNILTILSFLSEPLFMLPFPKAAAFANANQIFQKVPRTSKSSNVSITFPRHP